MCFGKDEIGRQIDGVFSIIYNLPIAWKLLIHKFLQFRVELMGIGRAAGIGARGNIVKTLCSSRKQRDICLIRLLVTVLVMSCSAVV